MIYSNDELKGESGTVDFADSDYTGGAYYRINPSKVKNGSIDINNVVIKQAEVSDIEITAPETVQIPENGTCETDISLSALTSDGYQTISAAKWSVDDIDDVEIESTGDRSAKLIIGSGAPSCDVVSISGMGTNDSSSSMEQFKQYNEIYINAIIDMGGYVILGSYTPSGNYGSTAGKVYDSDTMTFRGMRAESYDRAIREVYEERKGEPSILGFIDIGAMADAKMTEDVRKAYNDALAQGESAARNAASERAAEMVAWWKDYNHYYTDFSNYILPEITEAAAELIKSIE